MIKFKINRLQIVCCFLLIYSSIFSQVDTSDFGIWSSLGVDYSPIKKLKISVEQSLRLKEDAAVTDEYFTEVGLQYEIIKDFEIGGGARFIKENDNVGKKQGYESHFRFNIDASFKYDIERFTLSHRLRYQNKKELNLPTTEVNLPKETVRFKTDLEYNIRKWALDPEFSVELFSGLENVQQVRELNLDKIRLTFGTDYKFKNFGKFGIYYRYEENIIKYFKNENLHILGFSYSYSIN
ncbi:DUF2490 domain-containing protein [Polaribacter glomeratus]|uniref:DUF2490 domain-containing protein n=1 Tax=Polaribacter glomeratus TaxID=102 RepID=A0A2S7WFC5_9FLAO|nr:DUF2490 domain-containing protein [Polaribacter glomeratus]PQJ76304.1 hypothetical protein BTO16_10305 [Polaribacter glomeratus]TXD65437.1 DUF2490 domain-containing protein [Polaribacter glomeratus]